MTHAVSHPRNLTTGDPSTDRPCVQPTSHYGLLLEQPYATSPPFTEFYCRHRHRKRISIRS